MTPTQIETAARRKLNAVGSSFWSSDEIIQDYLYSVLLELAMETECIETIYETSSVASQAEYTKATRSIKIKRITYDGDKLMKVDQRMIDSMDWNNDVTTVGLPTHYWVFDQVINLWRTPEDSGKTIKIWSIDEPSRPTNASTLDCPSRYHMMLVDGVCYHMASKEVGDPRGEYYRQIWEMHKDKVRKLEKDRKRKDTFTRIKPEHEMDVNNQGII